MACELSNDTPHVINVTDVSGERFSFFHRHPTTTERIQYKKKSLQVKGFRLKNKAVEVQLEYAEKILTGIKPPKKTTSGYVDGFTFHGKPVSAVPGETPSPPNWFEIIAGARADLICQAAAAIFDSTGAEAGDADDEEEEDDSDDKGDQATGTEDEDYGKNVHGAQGPSSSET